MPFEEPSRSSSLADTAMLGKLMHEHGPKLLAMLRRRIDPTLAVRIDAEEIVQETFAEAWRQWDRFRPQEGRSVFPQLYRLALDRLIEAWRRHTRACRNARQQMPLPEASSVQLGLGLIASGTSPSRALARDELCQQVRTVMDLLRDKDREILSMRHFDGLSYADIAEVLEIEENTAYQRYHRALGRISDLWHQLHPRDQEAP